MSTISMSDQVLQTIIANAISAALAQQAAQPQPQAQAQAAAKAQPKVGEDVPEKNIAMVTKGNVLTVKMDLAKGGSRKSSTGNRYVALAPHVHFYLDENGMVVPCRSRQAPKDRTEYSLNLVLMEVERG